MRFTLSIKARHALLFAALLFTLAAPAAARTPQYRVLLPRVLSSESPWERGGAAGWYVGHEADVCPDLHTLHAAWWYDWGTGNAAFCEGVEYVPMIWGRDFVTATLTGNSRWLLGFNEPNLPTQAWMTPEEAVSLWRHLEDTGRLLVSPAVYADYNCNPCGNWLERFMTLCAARLPTPCRVDVIALHWYGMGGGVECGPEGVARLEAYLAMRAAEYPGYPLWLTEWACRWGEAEFAAAALPAVERYTARSAAWEMYEYPGWQPLLRDGALTPYGVIYAGVMP